MKTITVFYIFIVYALLFACASVESRKVNVNIEKEILSPNLRLENVRVTSTNSKISIQGNLHTRTRSIVPGHVDITFVSPDDKVLHTLQTDIRRRSLKSRDYHFHAEVPLVLPDGSTVRIVYHRRSHDGNG